MRKDDMIPMLLDKVTEIAERTSRIETKIEIMGSDLETIKKEDSIQNKLLDEHIRGVQTNMERLELEKQERLRINQDHDQRLQSLEEVPRTLMTLKRILIYVAAVCGAILTITRFLEIW